MKQELSRLGGAWCHTPDEASRTSYRLFMGAYEVAMKDAKKEFYTVTIASATSGPAQLFRAVESLTTVPRKKQKYEELDTRREPFESCFAVSWPTCHKRHST